MVLFLHNLKALIGCQQCGEGNPIVLDFDHIDPSTKITQISHMVSSPPVEILAELKKCQVLCCNCHRLKTTADRGNPPIPIFSEFTDFFQSILGQLPTTPEDFNIPPNVSPFGGMDELYIAIEEDMVIPDDQPDLLIMM